MQAIIWKTGGALGIGTIDIHQAVSLFKKASSLGHAQASFELGAIYEDGWSHPTSSRSGAQIAPNEALSSAYFRKCQTQSPEVYSQLKNERKQMQAEIKEHLESMMQAQAARRSREDNSGYEEDYEDDVYDYSEDEDYSSPIILASIVPKQCQTDYIFGNIINDLGASVEIIMQHSKLIQMTYAYARRSAATVLYIQGVIDLNAYDHNLAFFKSMQLTTGHTVEFQEQAFSDSVDYLQTYSLAITRLLVQTAAAIAQSPSRVPPKRILSDSEIIKIIIDTYTYVEAMQAQSTTNLVHQGGMRLEEAGVDIMFIAKNDQVIYTNDESDHLFTLDKDGDKKLNGRVVNMIFTGQSDNSVIEIFVIFNDSEAYTLFTLGVGREERFDYVSQAIFKYFLDKKIEGVFSLKEEYLVQYHSRFTLYQKGAEYFMVNSGQSHAYLIEKNVIKRGSGDEIKSQFWS